MNEFVAEKLYDILHLHFLLINILANISVYNSDHQDQQYWLEKITSMDNALGLFTKMYFSSSSST